MIDNMPELTGIPVVAVSGCVMKGCVEKAANFGFCEFLTKPLNLAQLQSVADYYCLERVRSHNDALTNLPVLT
jgi:CheY-like chemotaxis protein